MVVFIKIEVHVYFLLNFRYLKLTSTTSFWSHGHCYSQNLMVRQCWDYPKKFSSSVVRANKCPIECHLFSCTRLKNLVIRLVNVGRWASCHMPVSCLISV